LAAPLSQKGTNGSILVGLLLRLHGPILLIGLHGPVLLIRLHGPVLLIGECGPIPLIGLHGPFLSRIPFRLNLPFLLLRAGNQKKGENGQ
jgi:hypothetical protein